MLYFHKNKGCELGITSGTDCYFNIWFILFTRLAGVSSHVLNDIWRSLRRTVCHVRDATGLNGNFTMLLRCTNKYVTVLWKLLLASGNCCCNFSSVVSCPSLMLLCLVFAIRMCIGVRNANTHVFHISVTTKFMLTLFSREIPEFYKFYVSSAVHIGI